MRTSINTMLHIIINHLLYQKGSASVHKSVNTKPCMIKIISHARLKICIRRGMQVLKSVNTKLRTIKKNFKFILLTQLFIINIQIRKAEGSCTMLEV